MGLQTNTMKKALFLDRDGVINVDKEYLYKIEDIEFEDGIFELCRYFQNLGYLIIIVTNQSGIARGYFTTSDLLKLNEWLVDEFKKRDIDISKIYYCPHHPDITGECRCRKPKPGMLLDAKDEFDLDLLNSCLIGDKERDIQSAIDAGVKESYLYNPLGDIKESKASKIVKKLEDIWKNRDADTK